MSATLWKQALPAPPRHSWFEAFDADGGTALHDLLLGRFDLANLAATEPRSLLSEWVIRIGDAGNFSARLDAALTELIETQWGNLDLAPRAQLLAVWEAIGHFVSAAYKAGSNPAPLEHTAEALRDRLTDASGFGAELFAARGSDAFFTCLNAIALYQRDDSLRSLWWRLAELPDGFPFRYAGLALTGIRRLPASSGGFRYDVGIALFTIARAFSRSANEGILSQQAAVEELHLLYQRSRKQFPTMERQWVEVFAREVQTNTRAKYSQEIWQFLDDEKGRLPKVVGLPSQIHPSYIAQFQQDQDRMPQIGLAITWDPNKPSENKAALSRRDSRAVENAESFLNQQRDYARKTGLTVNLVQSLHLFASEIRHYDLHQAEVWVQTNHHLKQ